MTIQLNNFIVIVICKFWSSDRLKTLFCLLVYDQIISRLIECGCEMRAFLVKF